jgi:putative ABC transport system substrate-binding protein
LCSRVITDPIGAGYVENLARPCGNVTGFMLFEYGTGGKWALELALFMDAMLDVSKALSSK